MLGVLLAGLPACSSSEESTLFGPGPLQVVVGVTTMEDVLARLGPADNQITDAEGMEVWTYQRTAKQAREQPDFLRAYNVGRPQSVDAGDQRDLVLILKFRPSGVLEDVVARQSSF
jgi:hypothetical protein